MRLRVDDERVRIGMRAWMQTDAEPVEARVAFRREDGNGRGYFAANKDDLSAWSTLLHAAGVTVADGSGRIEAWPQLRGPRVAALTADVHLPEQCVQAATSASGEKPPARQRGRLSLPTEGARDR